MNNQQLLSSNKRDIVIPPSIMKSSSSFDDTSNDDCTFISTDTCNSNIGPNIKLFSARCQFWNNNNNNSKPQESSVNNINEKHRSNSRVGLIASLLQRNKKDPTTLQSISEIPKAVSHEDNRLVDSDSNN